MAYADFDCAKCGTSIRVGGQGYNRNKADSYARYCAGRGDVCESCRKADFAARNAAAVAASEQAGLPALTGSDKQVAWAASIRLQALPAIDKAATDFAARIDELLGDAGRSAAAMQEMRDAIALLAAELRQQTSANWWIDKKPTHPQLVEQLIRDELNRRIPTLAPTAHAEAVAARAARAAAKGV